MRGTTSKLLIVSTVTFACSLGTIAQDEVRQIFATSDGVQFGYSVHGAGLVDGDDVPDFVAGGWLRSDGTENGVARVFSGATGAEILRLSISSPLGRFGWAVAGAGDVNDDGVDDIIVGQPLEGAAFRVESGRAFVFSGADGSELLVLDTAPNAFDNGGWSVDGVGDVNADGHDDLVVGIPGYEAGADRGRVQVFSGADGSVLYTVGGKAVGDRWGHAVAGVGDVNGDGTPDFAGTGPRNDTSGTNTGHVRVYSGLDGSRLYTFRGANEGDRFGWSVAGAGDVNADGFADIIAGTRLNDDGGNNAGSASVFSGADGSVLYAVVGDANADNLGESVAGAGDVNGDGYDDFLAGAPGSNLCGTNSGYARLYSGKTGTPLYTFFGNSADDSFGQSVDGVGDTDGDGFSEVVIGAPFDRDTDFGQDAPYEGETFVFGGNDLYLRTNDPKVAAGDPLTLTTAGGEPGNATILFLNSIDGSPLFQVIAGAGVFDANGERTLSGPVPSGLSGITAVLQAYGVDLGGDLDDTAELSILFE